MEERFYKFLEILDISFPAVLRVGSLVRKLDEMGHAGFVQRQALSCRAQRSRSPQKGHRGRWRGFVKTLRIPFTS